MRGYFVYSVQIVDELMHVLTARLERELVMRRMARPIRLLVIDSITAIVRGEILGSESGGGNGMGERSQELFRIAACLKRIASRHGIAVLCVNQVSMCVSAVLTIPHPHFCRYVRYRM